MWGSLLAAAGAVSYGVTVMVGRRLAVAGLGPATVLGTRFGSAGLFLLLLLLLLGRPLLPARGERLAAFGLGAVLYAGEAACFFLGLERGTASAVALLQENPNPTDEQIVEGMNGNICRCNGYVKITNAVRRAARKMQR